MIIKLFEKYWIFITSVLVLGVIYGSLNPLPSLPDVPGNDKTLHFVSYAVLALPMCLAKPKHLFLLLVGVVIFSGSIELIQPYVNRHSDWGDFIANTGGVTIGYISGLVGRKILK